MLLSASRGYNDLALWIATPIATREHHRCHYRAFPSRIFSYNWNLHPSSECFSKVLTTFAASQLTLPVFPQNLLMCFSHHFLALTCIRCGAFFGLGVQNYAVTNIIPNLSRLYGICDDVQSVHRRPFGRLHQLG